MKKTTTRTGLFGAALALAAVMFASSPAKGQYESFFGGESWEYNICQLNEDNLDKRAKEYDSNLVWWACTTNTYTYRKTNYCIINGECYFMNENQYGPRIFLREDTLNGRLYARYQDSDEEFLLCDLSLSVGDTFFCDVANGMGNIPMVVDSITYDNSRKIIHLTILSHYYFFYGCYEEGDHELMEYNVSLRFMEGIGPLYGIRLPYGGTSELDALLCMHKDDTLCYRTHEDLGCFQEHVGGDILVHSRSVVNLYPNPATQYVVLDMSTGEEMDGSVMVTDMLGRQCLQQKAIGTSVRIPVTGLPTGMYFLTFTDGKRAVTRKFMKE